MTTPRLMTPDTEDLLWRRFNEWFRARRPDYPSEWDAYQAGHAAGVAQERDALRDDAERLDWIIEHRAYVVSDPGCCDGYWLNYARPDGTMWTQATEHETPRAAIDAAKGEPS